MDDHGELDVQASLRTILDNQQTFATQMTMVIEGLQTVMLALGIQEKLERIAKDIDEVTPVDMHIARLAALRR